MNEIKKPLRVLITNLTLASRTGTETYVRDLAIKLMRLGHHPFVYSPDWGDIVNEIRSIGIPVTQHLDKLEVVPDVIHGHHNLPTLAALMRYPNTPAILFCHDQLSWNDLGFRFPRIRRHVAVDWACQERLLFEHGIPEDKIEVIYNSVDTERFRPRGSLPPKPKRALVFGNNTSENVYLERIREACANNQIELSIVGAGIGNLTVYPEILLGEFDLIFGKARCALEAMATGAAVILYDKSALGGMVTTKNLDEYRQENFGRRILKRELVTVDNVMREILRYDPVDAAQVSQQVRNTMSLDNMAKALIELYQAVIAEHAQDDDLDREAEEQAVATFIQSIFPFYSAYFLPQHLNQTLQAEVEKLRNSLRQSQDQAAHWRTIANAAPPSFDLEKEQLKTTLSRYKLAAEMAEIKIKNLQQELDKLSQI